MAGLDGISPGLAAAFQALMAASPFPLGISSGRRTRAEQQRLYNEYLAGRGALAAPPGQSNHESGNAIDIDYFDNPQAIQWVHENAGRFGLHFPVRGENWHTELVGGEGNPGAGMDQDAVRFNLVSGMEPQNPEDVLSARLDSVMSMLTGSTPEAATPQDVTQQPMATDVTTIAPPEAASMPNPAPSGDTSGVKGMVQQMAADMGWGDQWGALEELVQRESSWNPTAQNPTSTAFGLFQFLDSTWAGVGAQKTSDPMAQARAGLQYIKERYGSPSAALAFHDQNNWY